MPILKYVGPLDTPFGVTIDHWVYDFDPMVQRELKLPSEREVVMLLEREPDLWEVVSTSHQDPVASVVEAPEGARSKRHKVADAESVTDGAQ